MNICIVAHNAYGALTGEESGHIGGVERQTALLALWLVEHGHQVAVITWSEGGENVEYIDGIRIIKLCKVDDGWPILRFLNPRWSSLNKALRIANAELYYHNCAEYVTGQVAFWCKWNKRPFIYSVASDADCALDLPNLKYKREKILFRYGLKNSNVVITQTYQQKQLLETNYSLQAEVINMPGTPPCYDADFKSKKLFFKQKVIWVGRLHKVKRIEWLIKIAHALPDVCFEVIGPSDDTSIYIQNILKELESTPNISYLGKIARLNMPNIYQNSTLLCNTSIYEGFPNTYLEAWSYGVPVITCIDPDHHIQKNKLGYQASHYLGLVQQIKSLLGDIDSWQEMSKNCLQYYQEHHQQKTVMQKFEKTFLAQIRAHVSVHFDNVSQQWSDFYTQKELSISHLDLQHRLALTENILSNLKVKSTQNKLLDLGCGTGYVLEKVVAIGPWSGVGVDISPQMVTYAQKKISTI